MPVESLALSNPNELDSNLENIQSEEVKLNKKRSLSSPTSETVTQFFKAVTEVTDTNDISKLSPKETQVDINAPPTKRPRFSFLRNSHSSTIL